MKKRNVAVLLSSVLALSMPLTVSAGDETPTKSSEVKTEGTVSYVNTTVYQVTLPTSGCFNFVMDPQGILSATDTDKTTYTEELYPAGTAGLIVASEGSGARINNMSSVPIKLTVDAYVESDDTTGAASSVKLMDLHEYEQVFSGIDNSMMLTLGITNDELDVNTFEDETFIKSETVNPDVIAIMQNGKPDTDADQNAKGTQISFALNKAEYEFGGTAPNYTYEPKDGEKGDSVGMRLGGYVNTNADWTAYTAAADTPESIIVKTIFTFDRLSTDYDLAALDGRAHGTLADTDPEYSAGMGYQEDGTPTGTPADGEMDYIVGRGALEIPFSFGTGTKEVTVTGITVNGQEITNAADYKVNNGVISLKSTEANVKAAMDTAAPEGTIVPVGITTSDGATTTVNVAMFGVQ